MQISGQVQRHFQMGMDPKRNHRWIVGRLSGFPFIWLPSWWPRNLTATLIRSLFIEWQQNVVQLT